MNGRRLLRKKAPFKRVITEDDLVVLPCHQQWPRDSDYSGKDIFRFDDNGKAVEQRDVLQVIRDQSANDNTVV